jgi:hypothetical protein
MYLLNYDVGHARMLARREGAAHARRVAVNPRSNVLDQARLGAGEFLLRLGRRLVGEPRGDPADA